MAMIGANMLKARRTGAAAAAAASWWKQHWIKHSVSLSVANACRLASTPSSGKQQNIGNCVNRAFCHTAYSLPFDRFPLRTMSTDVHSTNDGHLNWRFPADERMRDMFKKVQHDFLSQSITITLNAASPITKELMEEALNILYDKFESLRICFRFRQNALWVSDMPTRCLDFEFISGGDLEKHVFDLRKSLFDNHNGPLWKVRLLTSPPDEPCHFPEIRERFPYQYNLLISLHHAANDGRVLMLITESLFSIIDNLLQGLPVDKQEAGVLHDGIEAREEEGRIRAALENDPVRLKEALRKLELANHVPLLIEAFGAVTDASWNTHCLPSIQFDAEVMKRIDCKCRSLGVSTNAFLVAVLNTALVEVVREAGLKRSNYLISSIHPVDSRRLMGTTLKPALGYHGMPIMQTTATPHNVKHHFWSYVKDLNTELNGKLKTNYMCELRVLQAMLRPEGYDPEEQYAQPLPLSQDYSLSNVYQPFVPPRGIGTLVHITSLSIQATIHKMAYPVTFGFYEVHGKVFLEMNYSAATISKKVATKLFDRSVVILHEISRAL